MNACAQLGEPSLGFGRQGYPRYARRFAAYDASLASAEEQLWGLTAPRFEMKRKSSSITAKENPRRPYVAEPPLESTEVVRGSSRRIKTMCAHLGAIHEYQSDQSSVTGLDGFLVLSNPIHAPPPDENLDGSLHTRDGVNLRN